MNEKGKKLASTLLNMFLVLTVISLLSAAALGFTYTKTKPVLEELQKQKQIEAVAQVISGFDNVPTEEAYTLDDYPGLELYPAAAGGVSVGTAVRSFSSEGYGGTVQIMIGFDADGVIQGATVLSHTETPGLGAKMTEAAFLDQFTGFDPGTSSLTVVKDGGDVDAITAATISSRAFCDAARKAYDAVRQGGSR